MQKIIRIRNLDCAACAAELSELLKQVEGVKEASADFINQKVSLEYEGEGTLENCIKVITGFEEVELADAPRKESHRKEVVSIAVSALFFVPALVLDILGMNKWAVFALFLASFSAAGWSVVWKVISGFPRMFRGGFHPALLFDENLLMTIAAVGAFAIWEPMEGAAVMLLYQIGELLQKIAVGSSRNAIRKLVEMKSDVAILIENGMRREVDPEELKPGDTFLLRRGDRVPADCKIIEGETSLDTKSLTGESYLKEVGEGSEILAGCLNEGAVVTCEVLRPVSGSAVSKILDMVENSSSKKAAPERFITRFAKIYTPIVVLCALLVAVVVPLFTGFDFARWLVPAIEFLVISCPCALIISVPLTYFSGVGALACAGVLTKGAVYLDSLAKAKVASFDKTGTLTEGKFRVKSASSEETLLLAAAAEHNSSHPLAEAFRTVQTPYEAQNIEEIAGMGMSFSVDGRDHLVGSARLMRERGVEIEEISGDGLIVYVAREGKAVGHIKVEDSVRADAMETLSELKQAGIGYIAVLTGDKASRAAAALEGLPVDEVRAELLPEEKPLAARRLKEKGPLLYVGDGINDAPVLAEADVSVAMGGLGSDAAIEASDFVLAGDNLNFLPKAVRGAKKTGRIVKENIVFSIAVKAALLALSLAAAASGLFSLPIWIAVFGDVGVMLLAVLNALRMRGRLK